MNKFMMHESSTQWIHISQDLLMWRKNNVQSEGSTACFFQLKANWISWLVFRGYHDKTMYGIQQYDRLRGLQELSTNGEKHISISHHHWPEGIKAPKLNQHSIQRVFCQEEWGSLRKGNRWCFWQSLSHRPTTDSPQLRHIWVKTLPLTIRIWSSFYCVCGDCGAALSH